MALPKNGNTLFHENCLKFIEWARARLSLLIILEIAAPGHSQAYSISFDLTYHEKMAIFP